MKIAEKIDYGFESKQKHHNSYSFFDNDLRVKQIENKGFVVPWQMEIKEEKLETVEE